MQNTNFLFQKSIDQIAIVKSGYCWQYILPDKSNLQDNYICSLKKAGDYIFVSQCLVDVYSEAIEPGINGVNLEWLSVSELDENELINIAQNEKSFLMIYAKLINSNFVRRKDKCISPIENKLISSIIIDADETKRFGDDTPISLKHGVCIYIPQDISGFILGSNVKQAPIKDSSQPYLLNNHFDESFSFVELLESFREFLGNSLSYGILYESLISESNIKHEEDFSLSLRSLNIPFKQIRTSLIDQNSRNTIDYKFLFENGDLIDYGLVINPIAKSQKSKLTLYSVVSPLEKKLDFLTFFKELQQKPFSLSLIIVLSLCIQLLTLSVPLLFQQIIDKVISQQNPPLLPILTIIMIVTALMAGIFRASRSLIVFDVADRADEKFSEIILTKLINLKFSFFGTQKKGDIASRIQDIANVRAFFTGPVISTGLDLLFSVVYLGILLLYSVKLTAAAFAPMPIYMGLVVIGAPYYKQLVRKKASRRAYLFSFVLEVISGIQSVKLQGFGPKAIELWRKRFYEQQDVSLKLTTFGSIFSEIGAFCTQLSSILILFFGTTLVLAGQLTVGELIAFRIIAGFLTAPLLRLSGIWQSVQETQISLERVNKIIDYESENINFSSFIKGDSRQIVIRNIDFGYSPSITVLHDVSAVFHPGTSTALVGRSGSGKTTLIKLLTGLYDINSGCIEVGGTNIENISAKKLRDLIYCVPQESHFIGGTIEDNIRYGYPEVSEASLNEVLELVCLNEITESKYGVNGIVQEGGANFSGGQKQRLALARMILRSPSCIILDEATSALDSITESKILENLSIKFPNSTVIFITHRIYTASNADQIIMLENGYVLGQGSYKYLYSNLEQFAEMVDRGVNE